MPSFRHDWSRDEVLALLDLPFADLLASAHSVHRAHHDANAVQVSTLLSIKTGGCPEDCAYCPQAARYPTGVNADKLLRWKTWSSARKRPRRPGRRVSAWVPPGARRKIAMCQRSLR